MDRFSQTPLGRAIVDNWRPRAIPSRPALVDRRGHPRSILCLDNGPSSGDPRLRDVKYDRSKALREYVGEAVILGDAPRSAPAGERPS